MNLELGRQLELVIYSLLNYLPYVPFLLVPFRGKYRFPNEVIYSFVVLMGFMQVMITMTSTYGTPTPLRSILSTSLGIIFLLVIIDDHPGKVATTLLIVENIGLTVSVFSKYLEIFLFPESAKGYFHWTHSILAIIGLIIACTLNGIYNKRVYIPIIKKTNINWLWNYLWIVPLTFLFMWIMYQTACEHLRTATMEDPVVLVLMVFINIGSYYIYYILIKLVDSEEENLRLTYQENLQQSQYENLQIRIDDARKARHDLRHHLRLLDALVQEGDLLKVKEYLYDYRMNIPDDHNLTFCEHYPINAMLVYFDQQCKDAGVTFEAKTIFPSEINIPTSDLSIVFGNLLENALNACKQTYSKPPKATLIGCLENGTLFFQLRNTADTYPKSDGHGNFYSTSHPGIGLGTQSVASIVENYHGTVRFDKIDEDFQVTVIMQLPA